MRFWQGALIVGLAAGITVLLGLVTQSVLTTEFEPQGTDRPRFSLANYVPLHSPNIICGGHGDAPRYKSLPDVPVAPYLDHNSNPFRENPHVSRAIYQPPGPKEFLKNRDVSSIDFGVFDYPLPQSVRIPPELPPAFLKGNSSGYCKFTVSYNENGMASDIEISMCTHRVLETTTIEAVKKWSRHLDYCRENRSLKAPHMQTMRYQLLDENGDTSPYP